MMEYIVHLNPQRLESTKKIYEHLKTQLCNAIIQVSGFMNDPQITLLSATGNAGVLRFELPGVAYVHDNDPKEDKQCSFNFKNLSSLGREFMHSAEMFGWRLQDIWFKFYEIDGLQFVESNFQYDDHTNTSHRTVLPKLIIPSEDGLKHNQICGTLILTTKTVTALNKMLQAYTTTYKTAVRVTTNDTLCVVVFSINGQSVTVDYKELVDKNRPLKASRKAVDQGWVDKDLELWVNAGSLRIALNTARIPGVFVPRLKFHEGGILEVDGYPIKDEIENAKVSITLLAVNPVTGEIHSDSPSEKEALSKDQVSTGEQHLMGSSSPPEESELDDALGSILPDASIVSNSPEQPEPSSLAEIKQTYFVAHKRPAPDTKGSGHFKRAKLPKLSKLKFNPSF